VSAHIFWIFTSAPRCPSPFPWESPSPKFSPHSICLSDGSETHGDDDDDDDRDDIFFGPKDSSFVFSVTEAGLAQEGIEVQGPCLSPLPRESPSPKFSPHSICLSDEGETHGFDDNDNISFGPKDSSFVFSVTEGTPSPRRWRR
jgi:hypothetical protein